ncbi:hypothetical protein L228DRAFT_243092 [Xylona heveae TC161]|uniref:Uncharacterized protein n=1 Tax=Xylona heveae (strain CBS 132557 / TC161) TaxID=1328760 RepID=A0A165JTJ3_XYLHT|nr:hypothetical protein L228DRAFT_243092 [Xylona heveae TC161]KZF26606.1 hypothetical protein L228DRAFT_243092 [Xylona heveae TC161]
MEATTGAKASQDVFKQGGRMVVEAEPKGMVGQTKNLGADIVVMPPDPTQAPFIVHQPMHQGAISSNPLHSFNQRRQEEQMYGDLQQQKPSQFSPQHQAPPTAFAPPPPPPPAQTHMPGPHGGLPQQQYYTSRVPVAQHHPTLPQPQTEIHPKQQYYAYQPSRTVLISGQDQYANKENKAARSQGRPGVNEPSKGIGEQEKRQYVAQKPRRNSQNMLQEEKLHRKQKKPKAAHASSYARINDWLEESEYEKENDIFDKTNDSGTDSTTNTSVDTDCISPDLAHRRGSLYRGHRTEPVYKWHQRKAPEDTSSCLSRRDQDIISEILSQLSLRDQLAASSRQESCPRLREHVLAQVRRAALLNKQIFQQPLLTSHHQHPGIFPEVPYASHYLDNERGRSPEKRNMLVRPNISHAYMHVDPRDITGRRRAGVPVQCRPASVGRL